ncbi:hypothetical protein BVRB_1g023150 [Beta vulgaris subsp. vulgaris]|uniref:Uncharacterized protein n=1 Tax=Beta vulgaris subsp. vulgaris TaxID=3555 RepID=A0A0J8BDV4_BETVV|nr:hypothetical protein BVRB_1g023150 [Beta vulgaris subsp. vulgaris]
MANVFNEIWDKCAHKVKLSQSNREKTRNILSQDEVLFASDEIVELLKKFETQAIDTYQGKKISVFEMTPPSFSLEIDSNQTPQPREVNVQQPSLDLKLDIDDLDNLISTPEHTSIEYLFEKEMQNLGREHNDRDLMKESKRPKHIVQNLPPCFRYPFLVKYENLFKNLTGSYTTLSDYAFQQGNEDKEYCCAQKTIMMRRLISQQGPDNLSKHWIMK